ncbi:MAG: hypothetical protein GX883_08205 [Firmicutes bacterium]|nr:hypothetical protein [Bacillota bacterium]
MHCGERGDCPSFAAAAGFYGAANIVCFKECKKGGGNVIIDPQKIRVLRVSGSPYERSREHARELGGEALSGSLDFYRKFWEIKVAHMVPGMPGAVRRLLVSLIDTLVVKPAIREQRFAPRDRELFRGYCEGVDHAVSYGELKRAAAVADTYNYCLGWLFKARGGKLPSAPPIPGSGVGCSSLIAWGEATADGEMIFGRNLDFFTGDKWIDQAVVLVVEPGPGEIPFTSVTSAGIPIEGITAFNAEGLAVSVHQNFSKAVSTRGRSIISISNEVAACARNISEAVKIISRRPSISGWSILVGSAADKEAVLIETDADGYAVTEPEGGKPWLCYANSYLHPRLQKNEFVPGHAFLEHNSARLHRMRRWLEEHAGSITPELMAAVLGDHYDPLSRMERPLGNTIAAVHNVTSAVMEPDKQRVWVALGPAPANTTPAYVGFDIEALRRGKDGALGAIPGNPYFHSPAYPALREYALAYQAFDELDEESAIWHLEEARRLHSQEPLYAFMLGIFYLKQGRTGAALEQFRQADKPFNSSYRRALVRLWQGRCYDLQGQREPARELYRLVLEAAPPESGPVLGAREALKRPYHRNAVKHVIVEFLMADAQDI